MYVTFKVGSLLRLLTITAVAAALVGAFMATPRMETPTTPQPAPTPTTQNLINARP